MSFNWKSMEGTALGNAERRERRVRESLPLEALADDYGNEAQAALQERGVRDEVARFSGRIRTAEGVDRDSEIDLLLRAIKNLGKSEVFGRVPDDLREQRAFAVALVQAHQKSLQ